MSAINVKSIVRVMLMTLLVGLLSSCTVSFTVGGLQPTRELVQRAIAIQLSQTQEQLSQHLSRHGVAAGETPKYEITRVVMTLEEPLEINDLLSYHVRGSYDLAIQLSDRRVTDGGNSFDLYLQRQKEGKSWRLARQQPSGKGTEQIWATYLIKPNGYI